jgi:acylphosphatase
MPTLRASVSGTVQGVGFRYFVRRTARELGLDGRAENLPDGSVRVEAQGPRAELEALLEALRRGPVGSHVATVRHEIDDTDAPGGARPGFEVR